MKGKKLLFGYILIVFLVVLMISGAFAAKAQLTGMGVGEEVTVSTKEIKSTDQYIEVDIKIPVIEGLKNKAVQDSLNSTLERDALDFRNIIEKQARSGFEESKKGNYPFHVYQAYTDYKVTYNKDNILSMPITYYSYTGGAHGMTDIVSRNINLKTGKDIPLKDMFKEGTDYMNIIKQEVIKQIRLEPEIYFEDAVKTVEELKEDPSFYIEDNNIVVYFSLYHIAPYASGIREFRVPFSADIIKEMQK